MDSVGKGVARVHRRRRWPARFLAALFLLDAPIVVATSASADRGRNAVLFGIALVVSLVWLYGSERRAVHVGSDGIRVVPAFGSAREYPWTRINGFYVRDWSRDEITGWRALDGMLMVLAAFTPNAGGGYSGDAGGPTVMIDLEHQTGPMPLAITRRSKRKRALVQTTCDELNAARASFLSAAPGT